MENQTLARSAPTRLHSDRIRFLFESICTDFITARYASHENAKRVLLHALETLYLTLSPTKTSALNAFLADKSLQLYTLLHEKLQAYKSVDAHPSIDTEPLYSEEDYIRELLKEYLQEFCNEIQEECTSNVLSCSSPNSVTALLPLKSIQSESFTASASEAAAQFITPPPMHGEIRMEGLLRKKGQHVNLWRERYFMIRTSAEGIHYLCYYRKKGDREPRGWYVLGPGTMVDSVRESPSKIETKRLFTFRIRNYTHASFEEAHLEELYPADSMRSSYETTIASPDNKSVLVPMESDGNQLFRRTSRNFKSRAAAAAAAATAATAVVLTGGLAGVGIGVGMGMSAAAAAAASAGAAGAYMTQHQSRHHTMVALAAESYETAIWWRNSILDCILQAEESWRQYLTKYMDQIQDHLPVTSILDTETLRSRAGSYGNNIPKSMTRYFDSWTQDSVWSLFAFSTRLRVFVQQKNKNTIPYSLRDTIPTLRTSLRVYASPKLIFDSVMRTDSYIYRRNHVLEKVEIVQANVYDHSDIIYYQIAPVFLWPFYAKRRDLCLLRYWRMEPNGSYSIRFHSMEHEDCPSNTKCIRGTMHFGMIHIGPRIDEHAARMDECFVTFTCQLNPNGWLDSNLSRTCYYMHTYNAFFLEIITYIPNVALNQTTHFTMQSHSKKAKNHEKDFVMKNVRSAIPLMQTLRTDLSVRHCLATKYWSEPCASSFQVRGPTYRLNGAKISSSRQLFRLMGVQLLRSNTRIEHIGLKYIDGLSEYPKIRKDTPQTPRSYASEWVWIVNIVLPEPSNHSLILYYTPENIQDLRRNSDFADLCHRFMHGPSDAFRRDRLKLIPRVVKGAEFICNGIDSTPTILGTKLDHKYFHNRHYFEIDYDIGSSHVASELIKLILRHCNDLILDLALVIEAKEVTELPERILATTRLSHIDIHDAVSITQKSETKCKALWTEQCDFV